MAVQYSRGCPFKCALCDIIEIYGRVPRTQPADLVIAELEQLYANRWRGPVFFIDDNFVRFDSDTDGDQRYSRR